MRFPTEASITSRRVCRVTRAAGATAVLTLALCALSPCTAQAQSKPSPEPAKQAATKVASFYARNSYPGPRRQVVRASIPFARGALRKLDAYSVQGYATAWEILTRWPDRSIQWAQAQCIARLDAGEIRSFHIVREARPIEADFVMPPRLSAILLKGPIRSEVMDPLGVLYQAKLVPDKTAGPDGLLRSTKLVRVYRFRSYHRAVDPKRPGIGRDYLSLTAYLTLYSGFEHAELLLIVGNDYAGSDHPNGSKDPNLYPIGLAGLRRIRLYVDSPHLAYLPRWIRENGIPAPTPILDGKKRRIGWQQDLLPESGMYWLGDCQMKAYKLVLFAPSGDPDEPPTDKEEILRRQSATAIASAPLYPLPDVDVVRRTGAMNAHGGPAPATPDASGRAIKEYAHWKNARHFGPMGLWGDIGSTTTTGTPRNTTIGLHLAVRTASRELMEKAEGWCLQQALRGYHLWNFRIREDQDLYLSGFPKWAGKWISADTLGRGLDKPFKEQDYIAGYKGGGPGPNNRNPYDYEHFTCDVLYDYYCLTGSPFAREELRQLGEQLMGHLTPKKYFFSKAFSSRGEGWTMKGLALCYQATRDERLKKHAIYRLLHIIDRDRGKPPNTYAVSQDPHPNAFGPDIRWDGPWQQAAYVMGMCAGYRYFGHEKFREIAIDVARYMANQGWAEGIGPKYFVAIEDPKRYSLPKGYGPLGGTAEFEVTAFVLAAELADEVGKKKDARLFRKRAATIVAAHAWKGIGGLCANKWFQIFMDRFPSGKLPN